MESRMAMKQGIPSNNRDLRRYVARNLVLRLMGYVVWIAAFWLGAQGYNDSHQTNPPEQRIVGWRMAVWMMAAAAIGFFLFRLWRLITQRGLEGRIEKSKLSHSYASSADPGAGNSINYDFRMHTYLVIRDKRGRRRRIRFEQKSGFYLYYYPGSYVRRFAGLPYPVRDPRQIPMIEGKGDNHDDLSNGYLCVACGNLDNRDLKVPCGRCGYSLIDPAEVAFDLKCDVNK